MRKSSLIPWLSSTPAEVMNIEKDFYHLAIKELPPLFLGFQNPDSNCFLNPAFLLRLMGARFEIIEIKKDRLQGSIHLVVRSNLPLEIGQKVGSLFIKDDRFLVHKKSFLEELKKEHLLDLNGFDVQSYEDHLTLKLKTHDTNYRLIGYSHNFLDLSDAAIEKLLVEDSKGAILKFHPIQHDTLYLVADICLEPKGAHTPLLHHLNGQNFNLYTESCYRQKISFFSARGLRSALENPANVKKILSFTPSEENRSALFLTSLDQLEEPLESNWVSVPSSKIDLPHVIRNDRQHQLLERFLEEQPEYPVLEAIQDGQLNSEGVLFVTYLPSFFLRGHFLQKMVRKKIKRIYFLNPSKKTPGFFSHADRSFLLDLNAHGIEVFWFDRQTDKILQFCERVLDYTGIFLPPNRIEEYHKSLSIGIYGSSSVTKDIECDIKTILQGLLDMRQESLHPLLNITKTLSVSTGGGPGVMNVANKVAYEMGILSIAHLCNFSFEPMNPHLDGKMTYRIEKMIERQAEFLVKLPIFFIGGFGTDLELGLEIVGRQVGSYEVTPILLFGEKEYWEQKISSRFILNVKTKTLRSGEYLSNCLIQVETGDQAVAVYKLFFTQKLALGNNGRIYSRGFRFFEEIYDDV